MRTRREKLIAQWLAFGIAVCILAAGSPTARAARMIGYWDGWGDLRLGSVSPNYDVVMLSFATGTGTDASTMSFTQSVEPTPDLIDDIAKLRARGVKVLISVGGGGGPHTALLNAADRENFVNSVQGIVGQYKLDGVDLDLEDGIFAADDGDNDIFHPTTPTIVNLIAAMHELRKRCGPQFMITAPAESEAMNGYGSWGNQFGPGWISAYGGFLAFLNGTRDILTFVAPQYYNAATYYGLDNNRYSPGSPDFDVSQAELILHGYTLVTGQYFPPLDPDQFAIGVPATPIGDDSYNSPAKVLEAAEYIGSGVSFGGKYQLASADGYPAFGGVMTWDINADESAGYALSNTLVPYLHSLRPDATTVVDYFDRQVARGQARAALASIQSGGEGQSLVYHFGDIVTFNLRAAAGHAKEISVFASTDGATWSPVALTVGASSMPRVEPGPRLASTGSDSGIAGWCHIIPDGSLAAGTNYLKIVANGSAISRLSISYLGEAESTATPDAPGAVAATGRNGAIALAWAGVSGASAYEVSRGTASGHELPVGRVEGCGYVDARVAPGVVYYYRVAAMGPGGASRQSRQVWARAAFETGYRGGARAPGTVKAVDYDRGGPSIAYRAGHPGATHIRADDAGIEAMGGGGYDVRLGAGDWVNYTVDAEAGGTYDVALRAVSTAGATLRLRAVNGLPLGPALAVAPGRGWSTVKSTAALVAGRQIVRLSVDRGDAAVESLGFADRTPPAPAGLLVSAAGRRGGVNLFWRPSTSGAVSYTVLRGTSAGGETPIATGVRLSVANAGCVYKDDAAPVGSTFYYTVKAVNASGSSAASNESSITLAPPKPFHGTPLAIPGLIDFSDYDSGGDGAGYFLKNARGDRGHAYRKDAAGIEPCTDTDGKGNGFDIGWTEGGDWLLYTVDVAQPGKYSVTFRIAAAEPGSQMHLQDADGNNLTGSITLPGTGGWQKWTSVTVPVTLPAGTQDISLVEDTGGFNVEYMDVRAEPATE